MIYLASPYSAPTEKEMQQNYDEILEWCFTLQDRYSMHSVYSSIVHFHPMSRKFSLPTDAAFWWGKNRDAINSCELMLVATMDGWRESKGVQQEIAYCKTIGKTYKLIDKWGEHVL